MDKPLLQWIKGRRTPSLWASFLPKCLMRAVLFSCLSRVARSYRVVSTHCIGSPKSWTGLGFWKRLTVLAKSNAVRFETLIAIVHSLTSAHVCRDKSPDKSREAMCCGTWLREPCHLHTVLARRGGRVYACRLHRAEGNREVKKQERILRVNQPNSYYGHSLARKARYCPLPGQTVPANETQS
jgi:hypothetical protein